MSEPLHEDVLHFVQRNSAPFVTTGDVAEQFDDVTERTVRERLHDLVEDNRLSRRKVGPSAQVWYTLEQD